MESVYKNRYVNNKTKTFSISVIISIYNLERYLEEAILSVINQTIGFKNNVQLILVNDGSMDRSESICLKYADKYPDNIVYIKKNNGGVSSSRNIGIENASGELICFLDGDDKFESHAFEHVWKFYLQNKNEVDVISCRTRFFEAREDFHVLDFKFDKGTRIANLESDIELFSVQSIISVFVKKEAIKTARFDPGLKYGEDSLFINTIIMKKMKYGLVREALYLYRRRKDGSSAVQMQRMDKRYYLETCKKFYKVLLNQSKLQYGSVKPYIQSVVYYDVGWRLSTNKHKYILSEDEQIEYEDLLRQILSEISYPIILKHPIHINFYRKNIAIMLSNGHPLIGNVQFRMEDSGLYYKEIKLASIKNNKHGLHILNVSIADKTLVIEGIISRWFFNSTDRNVKFGICIDDKTQEIDLETYSEKKIETLFGDEKTFLSFKKEISLRDKLSKGNTLILKPYICFDNDMSFVGLNYEKKFDKYRKPYVVSMKKSFVKVCYPYNFFLKLIVNKLKKDRIILPVRNK